MFCLKVPQPRLRDLNAPSAGFKRELYPRRSPPSPLLRQCAAVREMGVVKERETRTNFGEKGSEVDRENREQTEK